MTLRERLERWRAHRRLSRGQCSACRRILPDDWTERECPDCAGYWSAW